MADCDRRAPAQIAADHFIHLPPHRSPDYFTNLASACARHEVSLLVPLHDYEISTLAGEPAAALEAAGTQVMALARGVQSAIEDKYAFAELAAAADVATPPTRLAADLLAAPGGWRELGDDLVVKHRYGSGSSGLAFCAADDLEEQLRSCALTAPDRSGRPPSDDGQPRYDLVVVQRRIRGVEYGFDVVSDFDRRHLACLARRKFAMRAGETDRAVTVDPGPIAQVGARLAAATGARGLIDVDAIVDEAGETWVIDVNPRFGGGYPFSHLAGADVPACYVAWHAGKEHDPKWLVAAAGVTGAKYESVTAITGAAGD
nr:ATP-grasp domain-containing protein [Micromonospora zingiberis]